MEFNHPQPNAGMELSTPKSCSSLAESYHSKKSTDTNPKTEPELTYSFTNTTDINYPASIPLPPSPSPPKVKNRKYFVKTPNVPIYTPIPSSSILSETLTVLTTVLNDLPFNPRPVCPPPPPPPPPPPLTFPVPPPPRPPLSRRQKKQPILALEFLFNNLRYLHVKFDVSWKQIIDTQRRFTWCVRIRAQPNGPREVTIDLAKWLGDMIIGFANNGAPMSHEQKAGRLRWENVKKNEVTNLVEEFVKCDLIDTVMEYHFFAFVRGELKMEYVAFGRAWGYLKWSMLRRVKRLENEREEGEGEQGESRNWKARPDVIKEVMLYIDQISLGMDFLLSPDPKSRAKRSLNPTAILGDIAVWAHGLTKTISMDALEEEWGGLVDSGEVKFPTRKEEMANCEGTWVWWGRDAVGRDYEYLPEKYVRCPVVRVVRMLTRFVAALVCVVEQVVRMRIRTGLRVAVEVEAVKESKRRRRVEGVGRMKKEMEERKEMKNMKMEKENMGESNIKVGEKVKEVMFEKWMEELGNGLKL